MLGNLLRPAVDELIEARDFAQLRELFAEWPPADVADVIADVPEKEKVAVFRVMPQAQAAEVFEYLSADQQQELLHAMGHEQAARILDEMAADDRTALLEEMPAEAVRGIVANLSPEERRVAQILLGYPEGSVGRLMTPDFVAIRPEMTVGQVLQHIRERGQDSETLNVLYVVDAAGQLVDDQRIREFLLRPLETPVSEMMKDVFVSLKVTDPQESAVEVFRRYDRTVLPVTDGAGKLVGVVTVDDVLDVAEQAATEDQQKFGGMAALETSYMDSTFWHLARKRGPWLALLFVGQTFTASAMGAYEEEIKQAVILSIFVPMIISSGGNSGSQAATLIIRAMALGEVTLRDWWAVARREVLSGLVLGAGLGALGFGRVALWAWLFGAYQPHWLPLAITVAASLLGVVLWGTISGSMLPFFLRLIGADPATSSAPFVATLVDVTGLIIFFSAAAAIFMPYVRL